MNAVGTAYSESEEQFCIPFTVNLQTLRVTRQRSNHVGGGTMAYDSWIDAQAYYSPASPDVSLYFETDIWGSYSCTKKTGNSFSLGYMITWYLLSGQDIPYMKMRAVVKCKGKKYYSNWMEYRM